MPYKIIRKGRKKGWRGEVMFNGKRFTKQTFSQKKEAIKWERKKKKELLKQEKNTKHTIKLTKALSEYLEYIDATKSKATYAQREQLSRQLVRFFGPEMNIIDLTEEGLKNYFLWRIKNGSVYGGIKDRRSINAFLNWFKSEYSTKLPFGWNPMSVNLKFQLSNKILVGHEVEHKRIPNHTDVSSVLFMARNPAKLMIILTLNTAARRNDIECLTWADVDWEKERIRINNTKTKSRGGKEIWLPLISEAVQILREWYALNPSPWLFKDRHRSKLLPSDFLKKLCKEAQVQPFDFPGLRAFVPTYLSKHTNLNLLTIKEVMGHRSVETTQIYVRDQVSDAIRPHLTGMMERLTAE
jgi:integrase